MVVGNRTFMGCICFTRFISSYSVNRKFIKMKNNKKTVISLFDGMGGCRIALEKSGFKNINYLASEIDEAAMNVVLHNYPMTRHIGSVVDIQPGQYGDVFLVTAGSPCTDLSRAGKESGMVTKSGVKVTSLKQYLTLKKQGKKFQGQSYLFWEAVRVIRETKPKYFLFENTLMDKEWEDIISKELGVKPLRINSSLVSAQNRDRLYWTNIPNVTIPKDRKITLEDVCGKGVVACGYRGRKNKLTDGYDRVYTERKDGKSNCLVTNGSSTNLVRVGKEIRELTIEERLKLQTISPNYCDVDGVTKTQKVKMTGNGWTIDVISHIFNFIPKEELV